MWVIESFSIDDVAFLYEAKVYVLGSKFGINNGRISKLQIVKNIGIRYDSWTRSNTIVNYDRGWDIRPKTELEKKALDYVLDIYK